MDKYTDNYRLLFYQSIDAIFFADQAMQLVKMNPAMIGLLGHWDLPEESLELRHLFHDKRAYEGFREEMEEEGFVQDYETVLRHRNGQLIHGVINAVRLKNEGLQSASYQGIIHDVSSRKKAEKLLLRNEKLALSGRLARSIAHEVRNPLTNINLSVEQLREEFKDKDISFYTDIILRSCQRIERLINQLMESSSKAEIRKRGYSVNKLLRESLQMVIDRVHLQQVEVVLSPLDSDRYLMLDPQKMRMAITNLLINALDILPEGKGRLELRLSEKADAIEIIIQDNGPGMDDEQLEHLFDPFYSAKEHGMGLGLTITRNIIERHEASITAESEIGKGSCFTITLPSPLAG